MIKYILMDIEGTTTRISFVKDVLFPFSYQRMENYLQQNQDIDLVKKALEPFNGSVDQATIYYRQLIEQDVKHPVLKELQGPIWKEGYKSGELVAHLYSDVVPCWKKWSLQGIKLGIYSSGSVAAQKLLFGHTEFGDLNSMLSDYFDLNSAGIKTSPESYLKILQKLQLPAEDVLFLSDMEPELEAARAVGMNTYQLFREGPVGPSQHQAIGSFDQIQLN